MNDLVELLDQHHFRFIGRTDEAVNSGGVKIFPSQVEEKIASFIQEAHVVHGVPDSILGSKLVLTIEGLPWLESEVEALRLQMKSVLEPLMMPKEIRFRENLERTSSGKIKRTI
jgi:o-succinylbenzoate---CoA ligase